MENPDGDHQRDQGQSQRNDLHIHLAAVPDHSGEAAGKQSSESDTQNDSDGEPDGIPYISDNEEESVSFDPKKNSFLADFMVHDDLPSQFFV